MELVAVALLAFSIILLVLSLFLKDPYKELRNEFDQFSMQQIQDIYQVKRKLKILEEELLMDDNPLSASTPSIRPKKKEIHDIIKNQVWSLAQQGTPIEQIARQSSLTEQEVTEIIEEYSNTGGHYE